MFVESKHSHIIESMLANCRKWPPPPKKKFFDGKMETCLKNYKEAKPHWWLIQTVIPIIFPRVVLSQSDPMPLSKQKECIHWSFGLLPLLFFELPLFGWWPRSRLGTRSGVRITFLLKLMIDWYIKCTSFWVYIHIKVHPDHYKCTSRKVYIIHL